MSAGLPLSGCLLKTTSMKTRNISPKPRWEAIQGSTFTLPDAGSATTTVSKESPSGKLCDEPGPSSYPQLRILLRDCGQVFRPSFKQLEAASLFRKDPRTVRIWIHKGQVPFHRWPSGERYFSPQDIEDILMDGMQIADGAK
jgi:hypothetical protein